MRRRDVLAGIGSLGVLATGGAVAFYGMPALEDDDDEADPVEPRTLEALSLDWHDGEPVAVPASGSVTVCKFFATWCGICGSNLPEVTAAHEEVGDDVQFLSITSERVGPGGQVSLDRVEAWWDDHGGGEWPIAVDETVELRIEHDLPGVPSTLVFDADGVVRYAHTGPMSTDRLLSEIEVASDARS